MNPGKAIVCGICAVMLLLALAPMPYAYYQLLRWVVCASAIWFAVNAMRATATWLALVYALLAVVYNPIAPFHMCRASWEVVNVLSVLVLLFSFAAMFWNENRQGGSGSRGSPSSPSAPAAGADSDSRRPES